MGESDPAGGPDHEAIEVHGGADHRRPAGAGSTHAVDGEKTSEVCRRRGISSATFYALKAKFGGMQVSDAKRLKALEEENAKLKRLYADAMLDTAALKELLGRKW